MSGISRIKNPINEALGLSEWGEREVIPSDFNSEIVETNQEFGQAGIDASKIKNLKVDTIEITPTGYIRSGKLTFIDTTNAGYILDANGLFIGNAGDTVSFKFDVPNQTLSLKGASINNGLFNVDSLGNTVVNSLKRNDFHWFTTFESLDGYGNIGGTLNGDDLTVATTNVINNVATVQKRIAGTVDTWSKKRSCKFYLDNNSITGVADIIATMGFGSTSGTLTARRVQILIDSNGYQAMCADGTTTTKTVISGGGSIGTWEIIFTPGVDAKFYGDGVLKATITTNLPTGTATSDIVLGVYIKTLTANVQALKFVYYDFWQEG